MPVMTWKEFKEYIESQGVTDDMEIDYIDIRNPDNTHDLTEVDVYVYKRFNTFEAHN